MSENEKAGPEKDGFLARWSRRKRQVQKENGEVGGEEPPAETAQPAAEAETAEEKANREAAEAVDLDSLTYESDFTVFTKSGVPELLRRKAMRKLWSSNPVLANLDGLNDYDEDFSDPRVNVFKSAWNVVGGYLGKEQVPDEAPAPRQESEETTGDSPEPDRATDSTAPTAAEGSFNERQAGAVADSGEDRADEDANRESGTPRVSLRQRLKG